MSNAMQFLESLSNNPAVLAQSDYVDAVSNAALKPAVKKAFDAHLKSSVLNTGMGETKRADRIAATMAASIALSCAHASPPPPLSVNRFDPTASEIEGCADSLRESCLGSGQASGRQ